MQSVMKSNNATDMDLIQRISTLENELQKVKTKIPEDKVSIIVLSGDFDKAVAAFFMANGAVGTHFAGTQLARQAPGYGLAGLTLLAGHGKGNVGLSVLDRHVLHNHVDVEIGIGQAAEQAGRHPRLVGHRGDSEFGLGGVWHHRADNRLFHIGLLLDNPRTRLPGERGTNMQSDLVSSGHFHRSHGGLGATHRGHFEQLIEADSRNLPGGRTHSGVGGENTRHIGVQLACVGAKAVCEGDGSGIGSASS